MRDLNIAYGNSRQAKTWVNKTIQFDELKERLKVTIELRSQRRIRKMNKAQRDLAKTTVGLLAVSLRADAEKSTPWNHALCFLLTVTALQGILEGLKLPSHIPLCFTPRTAARKKIRGRIVCPLTRDVTPEEFVAVSRYVAQMLGIDYFDECSYLPNQLMYWPSTPQNGVFVYKETDGG